MKLYTEEQVNKIALQVKDNGYYNHLEITPIELPSDEEIDEMPEKVFGIIGIGEEPFARELTGYAKGLKHGAKWVINQFKQQDK